MPLLVRPSNDDDLFEIVAGRRRYHAALIVGDEQRAQGGDVEPVPCAIMEAGDDAAALEASLIENIARLDPDEVTQWETFARMVKKGRTIGDIGLTFGLPDLTVRRILALGNLLPRIRDLYRAEAIDTRTVRLLTLATKAQQRDWLKLYDSEDSTAPMAAQLKAWLFGADISTKAALFPLDAYKGRIVADLFGENGSFADADRFWQAQNAAIAARIDAYKADGWTDVELLEPGHHFHSYEHEKTPKAKGGKVFVTVRHNGEVEFHEGWLSGKEARQARALAGKSATTEADRTAAQADRPETTSALQRYVDLHRHAAVRAVLLDHPGAALRLMVAHAIAGSILWSVRLANQRSGSVATDESVETSAAETIFDARRREALALLRFSSEAPTVAGGHGRDRNLADIFARLVPLEDAQVLSILAVVMGETLDVGSMIIELLGVWLKPDMASLWRADDAFFDGLRDRKVVNAMLRGVAGKKVSDANLTERVKAQKAIIRDCLTGQNDRKPVANWVPKWLAFPPASYVGRPFATLDRFKAIASLAKGLPAPIMASASSGEPLAAEPAFAIAAE